MTTGSGAIAGAEGVQDAARDYAAVRASTDIQFAPATPEPPPPPPEWLKALNEWLRELFEPLGRELGINWPVFQWILIGLAAILVLFIVWRLVEPLIATRRAKPDEAVPEWTPDRAAALGLLEEADRLAAAGDYDEATHFLLRRSVEHIAASRPDWLGPASTAREIAGLDALPGAARQAFSAISTRVERSLFALKRLDADDWQAARAAYADFALARFA